MSRCPGAQEQRTMCNRTRDDYPKIRQHRDPEGIMTRSKGDHSGSHFWTSMSKTLLNLRLSLCFVSLCRLLFECLARPPC